VPAHGRPPQPSNIGFSPRDDTPRVSTTSGNLQRPAHITASPPPAQPKPAFSISQYAQAQPHVASGPNTGQLPQGTYGAQELATSVYDSPGAQHDGQGGQRPSHSQNPGDPAGINHPQPIYQNEYSSSPPLHQQSSYTYASAPNTAAYGQMDGSMPSSRTPQPLQPSGPMYDGHQHLQEQQQQQQFNPYAPPASEERSSEPEPTDYYR